MLGQRRFFIVCFLICSILPVDQSAFAKYSNPQNTQIFFAADKFYRTELYFGMNKKNGEKVSDADWDGFLETEVTPRFPDGFTVFEAYGQYKNSTGKIVHEASRVLVLFYPKKERAAVNPKIEELRAAFKKRFEQESVLRVDFRQSVMVSF